MTRRTGLWLGGALALLLIVYLAAAPYITVYRMKSAAVNGDGEALSEFIDFPSVRQGLKDQFNVSMSTEMADEDNPFGALGSALAGTLIDKMVDAYVTPAGITRLMAGESPRTDGNESRRGSGNPFAGASLGYRSLDKFVVTVNDDDGEDTEFVLRRRGLGWKLTDVVVPPDITSGKSSGRTSSERTSSNSSSSSSAPPTVSTKEAVQLGDVQVEVPGIWLQQQIGNGSPRSTHEPRGIWVVALIKVVNIGNEEQRFDTRDQKLIVDGKTYSSDSLAADDVVRDAGSSVSLNPGLSDFVVAVFDVPTDVFPAREAALDLKADSGGSHVMVRVDAAPKTKTSASDKGSASSTSTPRTQPSTAAPKPVGVPPITNPDLGLSVPLTRPACDGTGIVVLGSAYTPGKYRDEVQRLLSLNPGSSYLRTDLTCPSLRQSVDGNPVYAVYRVAGTTTEQVCALLATVPDGAGTYGKWLDTDPDPDNRIECG
jgi:hypothetical protein